MSEVICYDGCVDLFVAFTSMGVFGLDLGTGCVPRLHVQ